MTMAAHVLGVKSTKTVWLISALIALGFNPIITIIGSFAFSCTAPSSKKETPMRIIDSKLHRQQQQQQNHYAKPWRYAPQKKTKWDVRHTKSFRFELCAPAANIRTPILTCEQSTTTPRTAFFNDTTDVKNVNFDCIPMHKKPRESLSHVLGKGLLWALFKDQYGSPDSSLVKDVKPTSPGKSILVETPTPGETHFVPDVVAFHTSTDYATNNLKSKQQHSTQQEDSPQQPTPIFWGESGRMSAEKAAALACKYPHTHLVHLRWGYSHQIDMSIFEDIETAVLPFLQRRTAPFEFVLLPGKPQDFVNEDGIVSLQLLEDSVQWRTARFDIDLNY